MVAQRKRFVAKCLTFGLLGCSTARRLFSITDYMKKRSISILGTRGIPARYGGFETFAEELSRRLVVDGWDVEVYCESTSSMPKDYLGVRLKYVDCPRWGGVSTILFDLRCLWQARNSADVVYMLGYGAALFCFIPRLWGREVWINMDGVEWARSKWSWPARTWLRVMEAVAMWTPDRIVADAQAIYDGLRQRHWYLPPSHVIPYGAEVVEVEPEMGVLQSMQLMAGHYCLVVCRLEPENHVREIIQGYLLLECELPLVVVGDHTVDNEYVRSLVGLTQDNVRFVGAIHDQARLRTLRYYARVYVHGHSVGGTNPSLLEAMGCGNVILAHDNPFNREVADESAVYFSSSEELAVRLNELLGDAVLSEKKGRQAKRRVAERYAWADVVRSYQALLMVQD